MTRAPHPLAATLAALAACAALLCLPAATALRQEAALLGAPRPRPTVEGVPDEAARAVPVLYALYRAEELYQQADNFTGFEDDTVLEALPGQLDALVAGGLLDSGMPARILAELSTMEGARNDAGFALATGYLAGDGGQAKSFSLVWHSASGAVVELYLSGFGPQQGSPADRLAAWRAGLGLDFLGDWQQEAPDAHTAGCYSAKAQAYLYCRQTDGLLLLSLDTVA